MKYENYLVALNSNGATTFTLGRGYKLEEDDRLAYVKMDDPNFKGYYSIIDIASGLFVIRSTSKKKLFELWKDKSSNPEFIQAIINARKTKSYLERISEASNEKRIWRESGYIIEGRCFEL